MIYVYCLKPPQGLIEFRRSFARIFLQYLHTGNEKPGNGIVILRFSGFLTMYLPLLDEKNNQLFLQKIVKVPLI